LGDLLQSGDAAFESGQRPGAAVPERAEPDPELQLLDGGHAARVQGCVEVVRRRRGGRRRPPQVGQRPAGQQRRPRGLPPPQELQRLRNPHHGSLNYGSLNYDSLNYGSSNYCFKFSCAFFSFCVLRLHLQYIVYFFIRAYLK